MIKRISERQTELNLWRKTKPLLDNKTQEIRKCGHFAENMS